MTKLATMGTSSCATIALQGFGSKDRKMNEAFKEDKASFTPVEKSVSWFYDSVLYPTTQDLERTDSYPFVKLMEEIDGGPMASKFIILTLNEAQQNMNGGYWAKEVVENGFVLVDKTKNSIGSMNYIYVRSNNRPEGVKIGHLND